MKLRRPLLPLLFWCAILAGQAAAATSQYWNIGGTGGDGIWSTGPGDKNWNPTAGAASGNTTWADSGSEVAVFQDTLGGTVTLFDSVTASGLVQNGANYTLNAGVIGLANSGSALPAIQVDTGILTVQSNLAGITGFQKTGTGILALESANTNTGPLQIGTGTLLLKGSLANTSISIDAGATLTNQSGGLSSTATLTNHGTLTMGAADTIATYTQNGSGSLDGTSSLTTSGGATLNGGTVAGSLLGNTTSTGDTLVSGSLGGGSLEVNGGTLTLTGVSNNDNFKIHPGATLIANNSDYNLFLGPFDNAGTFTINTPGGKVGSYTQQAGALLDGTAGLAVFGTAIIHGGTIAGHLASTATITGDVLVSGSIDGLSLRISGGTTTLTGILDPSRALSIAAGATLLDKSGGLAGLREPSGFTLSNSGTLTVQQDDKVRRYVQNDNGLLNGSANLNAANSTLNSGTVAGNLGGGTTISTGNVLVSGTLVGGLLDVTGGTLTLTGAATNTPIMIGAAGTLIDSNGELTNTASLTNAGSLTVNAAETIDSLTNNAGTVNGTGTLGVTGATVFNGGILAAPLALHATTAAFHDQSFIVGELDCDTLTTHGIVKAYGQVSATRTTVVSGTLWLTTAPWPPSGFTQPFSGSLNSTDVTIASNAKLVDKSGGLSDNMTIVNSGVLTMGTGDTVSAYISNGGTLEASSILVEGPPPWSFDLTGSSGLVRFERSLVVGGAFPTPTLTTTTALLNDGSLVSGSLVTANLVCNGTVDITGRAIATTTNITGGTLTNTGTLNTNSLNIASGATFVAGGTQVFNHLSTVGPGPATWQGDLTQAAVFAPGGAGATGTLAVTGNFTNAPASTLKLDLGTGVRDLVTVGGTATFGGTLVLNQISPVTPFVPVQVVAAGSYAGNFATLTENLGGVVWFNPSNGAVTTLSTPAAGDTLWGGTTNQSSAWLSLYDDVVEPGKPNVLPNPAGGYSLTSGPASAGNPDLLNALTWSTLPGGLNAAVLDRLSPEVYAGFQDYAIEATRAHQRTAMEAPSLGFIRPAACPAARGCKHALPSAPAADVWEYFAALDYFDTATDSSPNQADYDLSGFGLVTGARTTLGDTLRVGGYLALNEGSLDGALIDGDADGWSLGLFARKLVHARTHTLLTGGFSYGKYQFEGTRGSLIATAGSWTPAGSAFSGVDSDALEFYLGASALAFANERFRLIPAVMLRYACGTMDGFAETAGGPGSPVPLMVGEDAYHSAIAELSLRAEADLTDTLSAHGVLGFSAAIRDEAAALSATFTPGGRPFRATAAGLDGDAFFLGLGAEWRIRENLGLGFHWRADFRADAETENQLGLSTSFRF